MTFIAFLTFDGDKYIKGGVPAMNKKRGKAPLTKAP